MELKNITTRTEIISAIVNSKWNCRIGLVPSKVLNRIANDGLETTLSKLKADKERMDNDKHYTFGQYYSEELIELFEMAIKEQLLLKEFEDYIFQNFKFGYDRPHKSNYFFLKANGLLDRYSDFDSEFRGTITNITKVNGLVIIETKCNQELQFYIGDRKHSTNMFRSFSEALLYAMFDGKYFDTLTLMYNDINNSKTETSN